MFENGALQGRYPQGLKGSLTRNALTAYRELKVELNGRCNGVFDRRLGESVN